MALKAVVLHNQGPPEVLKLEEVKTPRPAPTQILIKVAACGICGHDQADRLGLISLETLRTITESPIILGHEISGIVVEAGDKVADFKVGDKVAVKQYATCGECSACRSGRDPGQCSKRKLTYRGWAEYVAVETESAIKVPDEVDLLGASVVACCFGTTLNALKAVGKVVPGETVLVTGAGGGLGVHGMQVARALGAKVIALTHLEEKVEPLKKVAADEVVVANGTEYWRDILRVTDGRGVDVVLDNVGKQNVFGPGFRALKDHYGRYVFTGQIAREKVEVYPFFIFHKAAKILGSSSTPKWAFIDSMEMVKQGKIKPVIEAFQFDDVVKANKMVDESKVFGRAVLVH